MVTAQLVIGRPGNLIQIGCSFAYPIVEPDALGFTFQRNVLKKVFVQRVGRKVGLN